MFTLIKPVLALIIVLLAEASSATVLMVDWRSVHYTWISNWSPCRDNKVRIKRSKRITTFNCGTSKNAVLTKEDFSAVEVLVRPVFRSFDATLGCSEEAIMDWSVYTYLTVGSQTKKMYSFDAEKNCVRGNRAAVEQLQETLEALNNKYFPR